MAHTRWDRSTDEDRRIVAQERADMEQRASETAAIVSAIRGRVRKNVDRAETGH